jgi:RimJ/RimL family protein N-acetyltransferase
MKYACEQPSSGVAGAFALMLQSQLPTLVTDRLILRAPKVEDFEAYAEILATERGQFMGGPFSREDAWADFSNATANWLLHGHGIWAICHSGGVVGFVLLGFEPGDEEPELGFMLREGFEGRGYATEAAQAARNHAFEGLGWTTLVSYIDPLNARSRRVAKRLGAKADGAVDGSTVYRYEAAA